MKYTLIETNEYHITAETPDKAVELWLAQGESAPEVAWLGVTERDLMDEAGNVASYDV